MLTNLKNKYLTLRYGKKKLERLRARSLPYVGDPKKLANMNNAELIIHLKNVLNNEFKNFFKKALTTPTVQERIKSIK